MCTCVCVCVGVHFTSKLKSQHDMSMESAKTNSILPVCFMFFDHSTQSQRRKKNVNELNKTPSSACWSLSVSVTLLAPFFLPALLLQR